MNQVLDYPILNNSVGNWLLAVLVVCLVYVGLRLLRNLAAKYLTRLVAARAAGWEGAVTELLRRTHPIFLAVVSFLVGSQVLLLTDGVRQALLRGLAVALVIQGGVWAVGFVAFYVERYREQKLKADPSSVTTVLVVGFLIRIGIWCLVALLVLDNLGVQITPLLTGLGIGGIAVALAVQTVLKDLLGSISIMLDRPFVIGDFLILGSEMGSVEYIGLRTTRIRSISGEQLVLSNADLLDSRIRNFGRMRERRVVFTIGVTYGTPRAKLIQIPQIIREAIESQPTTRFDRSHFKEYGSFSLNFETVFFVGVPDFMTYANIQQAINLRIHERFEQEGIEFAFPTQTLHVLPPALPGGRASPAVGGAEPPPSTAQSVKA